MHSNMNELSELLISCQIGNHRSIIGSKLDNSEFFNKLYIETEYNKKIRDFLLGDSSENRILIVVGNAGDGKTALLSYELYRTVSDFNNPEYFSLNFDATESRKRTDPYEVGLDAFFQSMQRDIHIKNNRKSILAINYGLAIDYFNYKNRKEQYPEIWEAISKCQNDRFFSEDYITILNMGQQKMYSSDPEKFGNGLLSDIVEKFDFSNPDSPFNNAFLEAKKSCDDSNCITIYNCKSMCNPKIRNTIVKKIALESIINCKRINPRFIIDRISKIILPLEMQKGHEESDCHGCNFQLMENPQFLVWNTIFSETSSREYLSAGKLNSTIEPTMLVNEETEEQIVNIYNNLDYEYKKCLDMDDSINIDLGKQKNAEIVKTVIRKNKIDEEWYDSLIKQRGCNGSDDFLITFLNAYSYMKGDFNESNEDKYSEDFEIIINMIYGGMRKFTKNNLSGQTKLIQVNTNKNVVNYPFFSELYKLIPDKKLSKENTIIESTPGIMRLSFFEKNSINNIKFEIPTNYYTAAILNNVKHGYNMTSLDKQRSEGIFTIATKISDFTYKIESVYVNELSTGKNVVFTRSDTDSRKIRIGVADND